MNLVHVEYYGDLVAMSDDNYVFDSIIPGGRKVYASNIARIEFAVINNFGDLR